MLGTIRIELDAAARSAELIPRARIAEYKSALKDLPTSAHEYWATAAAVINYQSLLNQMSGEAPDPTKIARACLGLTNDASMESIGNLNIGGGASKCVVDLDGNAFNGFAFVTCVVRYHNGKAILRNVRFINCRFVLDPIVNEQPTLDQARLLQALLDSTNGTQVTVNTTG